MAGRPHQGKKLAAPKVSQKVEEAVRNHLHAGIGILRMTALVGVGRGTVQWGALAP
jgi:hypothetical protein